MPLPPTNVADFDDEHGVTPASAIPPPLYHDDEVIPLMSTGDDDKAGCLLSVLASQIAAILLPGGTSPKTALR